MFLKKSNNQVTQFFVYAAFFLPVFALSHLNFHDFSFKENQKPYLMMIGGAVAFFVAVRRVKKERISDYP